MRDPKYKIGDNVVFFCKYKNENVVGEITNIRESKYNWDYSIRYQIAIDLCYVQWVKEEDVLEKIKKSNNINKWTIFLNKKAK